MGFECKSGLAPLSLSEFTSKMTFEPYHNFYGDKNHRVEMPENKFYSICEDPNPHWAHVRSTAQAQQ